MTPDNSDILDFLADGEAVYTTDEFRNDIEVHADRADSTIGLVFNGREGWFTLEESKALRRVLKAFEQSLK